MCIHILQLSLDTILTRITTKFVVSTETSSNIEKGAAKIDHRMLMTDSR